MARTKEEKAAYDREYRARNKERIAENKRRYVAENPDAERARVAFVGLSFSYESYYQAIRTAPPSRIQSIDMGRRALHDEGSRVLVERLKGKVTVDRDTSRRLFTLICALHWKG